MTRDEAQKALYAAEDAARTVRNKALYAAEDAARTVRNMAATGSTHPSDVAKLADAVANGFQAIHVLLRAQ